MTRITIDPVTRIEGHLKIEVEVVDGVVADAWSSGTLFRGIERILQGRDPGDAWLFTQRVCGVCTYVHGASSVRCVEDASQAAIPDNARLIRNLLMGGQFVHDHPVHFYHLHGLDWIDIVSALSASVSDTQALAQHISPDAPAMDFGETQAKLQQLVDSGELGPFAGGYWGHPAMLLSAEENLLLATHYLYALREQVKAARMHAIFGAKNPHLQSLRVGGVTCQREITTARINEFLGLLDGLRHFIDTVYLCDVAYVARRYAEAGWGGHGAFGSYLVYGEFLLGEHEPADLYLPRGAILAEDPNVVIDVDIAQIDEHVARSWYAGGAAQHPADGETDPVYTGYDTEARYSWLKAPRYQGRPMEVGPLARMLVAYGRGHEDVVAAIDAFLAAAELPARALHSTLGRTAARAVETKVIADAMAGWLGQLQVGGESLVPVSLPASGRGSGLNEAPRGALGHWIDIADHKIGNYQMVVPSTWNFGPRCAAEHRGPVEEALIGTPVVDPAKPVEILRTVHSFDPCIACAVHVIDRDHHGYYTIRAA